MKKPTGPFLFLFLLVFGIAMLFVKAVVLQYVLGLFGYIFGFYDALIITVGLSLIGDLLFKRR